MPWGFPSLFPKPSDPVDLNYIAESWINRPSLGMHLTLEFIKPEKMNQSILGEKRPKETPVSPPVSAGIFCQQVSLWMDCLELKEEEANATITLPHLINKFNDFKFHFSFNRLSFLLDHMGGRIPTGLGGLGSTSPSPGSPEEAGNISLTFCKT